MTFFSNFSCLIVKIPPTHACCIYASLWTPGVLDGIGGWDWDGGGILFYVCLSAKEEDCDKIRPFFWPFLRQNVQRVFLFYCTKLHDKHGGIVGGASKGDVWDLKLFGMGKKKAEAMGWFQEIERLVVE